MKNLKKKKYKKDCQKWKFKRNIRKLQNLTRKVSQSHN